MIYNKTYTHDDLYEALLKLNDGKTDDESDLLNAKLILYLVNEVDDIKSVLDIISDISQS